jgi:phasin
MSDTGRVGIPPEMRAFAQKSVDEAKKAFETYMDTAVKALSAAEGSAGAIQEGTRELGRKAMGFAEDNVAASFAFAEKLVRAKDAQEVLRLQAEFAKAQMRALAEQAKALGQTASETARDAAKPRR